MKYTKTQLNRAFKLMIKETKDAHTTDKSDPELRYKHASRDFMVASIKNLQAYLYDSLERQSQESS